MPAFRSLDVQDFINSHPLSSSQIKLMVLCFLIVAIDGFDLASIGFIAPAIKAEWGTSPAELAPLFGSGLFGSMLGAFIIGPFADHHGRKTILIFSVFFFGAASLLSAFSPNLAILIGLRFLTGFGLGGAMPSAVTLTSEFCPEARRSFLVTLMFCGFTLGSGLGGVVASQIVADYGWRSVLVVGGLLPLLLMPVLWWAIPESVRYLVMKGGQDQRIAVALHRIGPEADLTDVTFTGAQKPHGSPVRQLFEPDLRRGTMLLWLTFFMGLVIIYMLSNWLPTLIHNSGVSLRTASLITAAFQIGGTVGSIVLGRLMDSFNPYYVLGLSYASGGGFVFLIGTSSEVPWLMVLAIFGAGFSVSGSQVGANALAAAFYPTANRATGVAWANGIGRIGAVSGSMLGGLMLSLGLGMSAVLAVMAVPGFIAGASILRMGKVGARVRSRQVMTHS